MEHVRKYLVEEREQGSVWFRLSIMFTYRRMSVAFQLVPKGIWLLCVT